MVYSRLPLISTIALVSLLSSCDTPTSSTVPPSPLSSPQKVSQILRLSIDQEPSTLDPRFSKTMGASTLTHLLFEGLTIDSPTHPLLGLAQSIEYSSDKKNVMIHLRPTFWSDGSPLTAFDIEHSWKQMLDPQTAAKDADLFTLFRKGEDIRNGFASLHEVGIQAQDDQTLFLRLEYPVPHLEQLLALPVFSPVNSTLDIQNPQWSRSSEMFLSSGPYRLKEWVPLRHLILERNPYYTGSNASSIDEIHVTIQDAPTRYLAMSEQKLDFLGEPLCPLTPFQVSQLRHLGQLKSQPASRTQWVRMNLEDSVLQNKNIRQALSLAIAREELSSQIIGGGTPAHQLFPPLHNWEARHSLPLKRLDDAQRLFRQGLHELNLQRSDLPTLTLSIDTSEKQKKLALFLQHQWQQAFHIPIQIETLREESLTVKIGIRDFQMTLDQWDTRYPDPNATLSLFLSNLYGEGYSSWDHPVFQQLVIMASQHSDPSSRQQAQKIAEQILLEDLPVIPLYFDEFRYTKNPKLKGEQVSPLGFIRFQHAYLEKDSDKSQKSLPSHKK